MPTFAKRLKMKQKETQIFAFRHEYEQFFFYYQLIASETKRKAIEEMAPSHNETYWNGICRLV